MGALCPVAARAQAPGSRLLIAILNLNASSVSPRLRGFLQAMRDAGYVEGLNFDIAERYADGHDERLPALAEELSRLKPSLFVTGSMAAAFAALRASETIAVVGIGLVDPVGSGLAASEARPGARLTGTLISIEGLTGKQLAFGIEVIPGVTPHRLADQSA